MAGAVSDTNLREGDIAIVGMAAHLPGASDIDAYWSNLRAGVPSIRKLTKEELHDAGEAAHMSGRPDYVPYAATLDGFADFDAEFFGFSPKEAAIMDPQHRQFLECAWEAMENAAHVPESFDGPIGVFAGCGMGSYFYFNICSNPDLVDQTGMFLLRHTGNDKDFLSTRLSHIFDLQGPSINVQTACSTSLVATHQGCQALLNGECDMALAGGVTIELPHARGYVYKEGEILSPDGQCHAFDHRAEGTVFGSGVGVVVLRRLEDAVADGDHIWAVIRGSAVNNDGAAKAGYLAPSVEGQAKAIAEAHAMADMTADSIDYVECHGTGTYLGDPIEVAALTEAFRQTTDAQDFCRIGSVKTNIGHLDTAAGVASLIKASMAVYHREMPPSLGFEKPNPAIAFEGSPFAVNDTLTDWPARAHPPRAGVNSLGVGGTNAHVVLEAAPGRAASDESDWPFQLITVSGRTKAALDDNAEALAAWLRVTPDAPLADVAWTLHDGRRDFDKRRVVVAESHEEAARLLEENDPRRVFTHSVVADKPRPTFMFPGGGAQYAGMARDLYETEPVFADWMDRGLEVLQPKLDYDIRALWLPDPGQEAQADARLKQPSVQLPLIMITEYALAQLWMAWGVAPDALIGHSMGENTAACVAGVMSFEDCIGLVHLRGTLFDTVPEGGMLSVAVSADRLRPYLGDDLDLGAVNAPQLSVATGPQAALDQLETRLKAEDIDAQRIAINIAAHSRMLEPILGDFGDYLRSISLNAPQIPIISNRTGEVLTDAEATDPAYWVAHLRGTVNFEGGLTTLARDTDRIFIEVGPGKALTSLAGQHAKVTANQVIGSLRHPNDDVADDAYFMAMLGRVWATGGTFDWAQIWGEARRNRLPMPTYAFQRSPYFIEAKAPQAETATQWLMRRDDPAEWTYAPTWKPAYADCDFDAGNLRDLPAQTWLIFEDDTGLSAAVSRRLSDAGQTVITVRQGDAYARIDDTAYLLAPERGREGYDALIGDLAARGLEPDRIVHGWLVTGDETHRPGSSFFHRTQEHGFWSLFYLAQALGEQSVDGLHLTVLTSDAAQVRGELLRYPEKATVMGPARVIPREFPGVTCAVLDVPMPEARRRQIDDTLVTHVLEEALATPANGIAALRDKRYALTYRQTRLSDGAPKLTQGGAVLLIGGFGGIGLTVAESLIREHGAKIALLARTPLPPRADWADEAANRAPNDPVCLRIDAVKRLEQAGGTVLTLAGDVSNVEDMRAVKAQVEAELGQLTGIVHAAGVIDDAPILAKHAMEIEEVFTPKIHGTKVLDAVFPDGSIDWMVLFSSTSAVTAPGGQVDYVAANAYLNAFAAARAGGRTKVLALGWGIWADVGMAADAMAARTEARKADVTALDGLMIDEASFDAEGHRTLSATYRAETHWFLDEHRTKAGDAVLPGTGYLEMIAEALQLQGVQVPFEICDLYFLRPFEVGPDGARLRVTLPRIEDGYAVRVESAAQAAGFDINAEAEVIVGPLPAPQQIDIEALRGRMGVPDVAPSDASLVSPQEAHLAFGPRWRVIRSRAFGNGEGLADLQLPQAAVGDAAMLHPALMDLATGWAMELIEGYEGSHLWVPMSYASIRVFAPLSNQVVSWVRNADDNRADRETARFDITVADPDGRVLVEIEGFTIRKLEGGFDFAARRVADVETGPRPLSPAEERLRHNLTQGIRADEGAAAFMQALGTGQSQLVISSLDLGALSAQASETVKAGDIQTFERPELESEFVAPDTDLEQTLAGFWVDLLGVSNVGVEDGFFDLGGHSLIAVRLFAMVKKTYGVDLPISTLFEAPTIRALADLLVARGVPATGEASSDVAVTVEGPVWTHIVPMHDGDGGPKTPFFIVSGMFGNVLNLRHLGQMLGSDRPVYGLQARGLLGDVAPHDDLVDAARDMIAEIKQIQPRGPYMIGGFSGGGITAYEIGQQLKAGGESVAAIVMLDTPLPQRRPLSRADRAAIQKIEVRKQGVIYPMRWAANRIKWEIEKRRPAKVDDDQTPHFHDATIEAAFYDAIGKYQVRFWDGPLTLFRPPLVGKWEVAPGRWVNEERAYVLADNDWTEHAPNLEVFEVPGDHDSMVLEPNVRSLAARMKKVIDQAERQARARPKDHWASEKAAE